MDGKLHLNDLIWRTLETLKTRRTHGLQQNYTDKARTDNASRDYVDYKQVRWNMITKQQNRKQQKQEDH